MPGQSEVTQMGWEVKDLGTTVAGRGEYAAWFKDSEGNLPGIGQPIP